MQLPGSIEHDEPEQDIDAAAERLLKRWSVKKDDGTPEAQYKPDPEKQPEQDDEEPEERHEQEEEQHEEEEAEDKPSRRAAEDDDEVVVSVDGQEHRIAVKDLKRLFGQEASLTQKSQQVAAAHSTATAQAERHMAALQTMKQRAEERFKPFKEVDWSVAARNLSGEDYAQLKQAHDTLKTDLEYYDSEIDNTVKGYHEQATQQAAKAADECLTALTDAKNPKTYIEGFDEKLYTDIRQYATDMGVPPQIIDNTYDPVAIKLIHKAMLYDKGTKTAMKKLTSAPKNVNKTPTNDSNPADGGSARNAMQKLRQTGDLDDAAKALMARWGAS